MRNAQVCRSKIKLEELFFKLIQGFVGLFMKNGLLLISSLGTLNMCAANTKLDKTSMTKTKMWPKASNVMSVTWWAGKLI